MDCVKLVSKSKKPVILLGSQATLPPIPSDRLKDSLEVGIA
jgi:acetolactate synthase-like protein